MQCWQFYCSWKILTVSNVVDNSLWFLCCCSFGESKQELYDSLILKGGPLLSVGSNFFYILLRFPLFAVSKTEVFQKLMDHVEKINDGYWVLSHTVMWSPWGIFIQLHNCKFPLKVNLTNCTKVCGICYLRGLTVKIKKSNDLIAYPKF